MSRTTRNTYRESRAEAVAFYALCDRARAAGVDTAVDAPGAPKTTRGLRKAVRRAERALAVAA